MKRRLWTVLLYSWLVRSTPQVTPTTSNGHLKQGADCGAESSTVESHAISRKTVAERNEITGPSVGVCWRPAWCMGETPTHVMSEVLC